MWQAAFQTYVNVSGGATTNQTLTGATIDATSTVASKTVWPSSIGRTILSRFGDRVSVLDYCDPSTVDGSTDNSVCIQAANAAVCAGHDGNTSGGTVFFPTGAYVIRSATITFPCPGIHWNGQGYGNFYTPSEYKIGGGATIICQTGANDCLLWNGGVTANYAAGGGIRDMNINAEGMTTGTVLHTQFLDHFTASDLHVQAPIQFYFQEAGSNTVLRDIVVNAYRNLNGSHGLFFLDSYNDVRCSYDNSDQGGSCRQDRTVLQNIGAGPGVTQTGGAVLNIANFVQTVIMTDLNLIGGYNGIYASCYQTAATVNSRRSCPDFMRLTRAETEQSINAGLYMNDVSDIWVLDSYFNGDDTNGAGQNTVYVTCTTFCTGPGTTAWGFWMKGARVNNAKNSCVFVGIPGFSVLGNTIFGCNMAGNAVGSSSVGVQIVSQTQIAQDKGAGVVAENILGGSYGLQGGDTGAAMDGVYYDPSLNSIVANDQTSWTRNATVNPARN